MRRLPLVRGECEGGPRPCPLVSCRHHLAFDVLPNGNLRRNFPSLEVWELEETCSLDVADRGQQTLEQVAALLNLTRERLRQLEIVAMVHCRQEQERRGVLSADELALMEDRSSIG